MIQFDRLSNPFTVTTPEDMSAEDTVSLFVDVFTDFPKVRDPGHTFLHGPRGSGKSMMFRYLRPDCQCLANKCSMHELSFFSVYLPIKSTYLRLAELQRLQGRHADSIINEHFMVAHFAEMIFAAFSRLDIPGNSPADCALVKEYLNDCFLSLLRNCGWKGNTDACDRASTVVECLKSMQGVCGEVYREIKEYLKRLSFYSDVLPYGGALCGYLDFLLPILREFKTLPFMPNNTIYLLIDDADDLSETQTNILNSWVSTRTMSEISLKISTRHQYKTFYTVTGSTIDTPHDYAEVNISTVYTSSIKGKYMNRVKEIVKKRLDKFNIASDPERFFPEDADQEKQIAEIAQELKVKWDEGKGRGFRASDDMTRYARPEYIKSLGGTSKSSSTYSYAGFAQLVHLSSGIVRYFLDAASHMYNETYAQAEGKPVDFIPAAVQSNVVRKEANRFLFEELEKIIRDESVEAPDEEKIRLLSNLIQTLGSLFRAVLVSDRAERRVFSIAFSDAPSERILEIFKLGVQYGYFQQSSIGKKGSVTGGRTRLFILSRRLAPVFNLDPTSFAGYLFVTNDFINEAMQKPEAVLARVRRHGIDESIQPEKLPLFEEL